MNGKQAKRARAIAFAEAERQGLWKKGESQFFTFWRKLLAFFFPRRRRRYLDAIGRWYKATLKRWTRQAYIQTVIEREERIRFHRAQKRAERKRLQARIYKILEGERHVQEN